MISNFLRIESYKKGLAFSAGLNIVAKALGFINLLAITYFFGAKAETDVYFYCMATVGLMAGFLTSIDSSVLIPESMRLTEQKGKAESRAFLNLFLYIFLAAGIIVTLVLAASPVRMFLLISNFDINTLIPNSRIAVASVFLFMLMLLTTFLVDILTSLKHFTMPMISSVINSVFSLIFLLLFHERLGMLSVVFGLITAYISQLLFLLYFMRKHLDWDFSFKMAHIEARNWKNIFYSFAGNITATLVSYSPLLLFSGFGAGVITALNAGQRIADLPNLLIISQVSAVVGIKFNELFAKKDTEKINEVFLSVSKTLLFTLVPVSCLTWFYSRDLIVLLYRRGSFDEAAVLKSAMFLKYLIFLLPFLSVGTLVARLFMAGQKILQSFWYQMLFNIANLCFILAGIKYFGLSGYPGALVFISASNFFFTYVLLKAFFKMVDYAAVIKYFIGLLALDALLLLVPYFVRNAFAFLGMFFGMFAGCFAYSLCLIVINNIFSINKELNAIALGLMERILMLPAFKKRSR